MKNPPIHVSIIYPADPAARIPGEFGIDSFIRNLIRCAPDDIQFEVAGITTDPVSRPVGEWSACKLGEKPFRLFPVLAAASVGHRSKIPLSLRFTLGIARLRPKLRGHLLEFHRIEPSIIYCFDRRPKNAFIHQDMKQLLNPKSDILWRRMPVLYYMLENFLIPRLSSLFTVSDAGWSDYKERFKHMSHKIHYTRTFMNPDLFYPAPEAGLTKAKIELKSRFGLPQEAVVCVSVGRLDHQKDPLFLLEAFSQAARSNDAIHLIMVGDGALRGRVIESINSLGLQKRCSIAGLLSPAEIAEIHRGADLFVLSSAYEGMPIALLEAMACGLPAVATAVGEVPKVILSGINGELVHVREVADFASRLLKVAGNLHSYPRGVVLQSVSAFTPEQVLEPVYQNYRNLAGSLRMGPSYRNRP